MDDLPAPLPPPPPPPGFPIGGSEPDVPKRTATSDMFYKNWDKFTKNKALKTTPSIDRDEEGQPSHHPDVSSEGIVSNQCATTSYEEAVTSCKAKVEAIVDECKRLNVKYYDHLFDLAGDEYDCLVSLSPDETPSSVTGLDAVGSVKRVEDIYENPQFFVDGISANDVRQGYVGDCWFLAAITALSGKPELIEKLCVARDEKVGVYGFVFYRDGEWISEVVDDRLFLKCGDDNTTYPTEYMLNVNGRQPLSQLEMIRGTYSISKLPKEFRNSLRKGSNALYFSSCRDSNETWLPLLEKAYAKAHGDYQSIEGGFTGEGIEDLTGGVAITLPSDDILDKDRLWSELMAVNKNFLFGCSSRRGRDSDPQDDEGFVRGHAYTVLEAREIKHKGENVRLLKIRNPWGEQEWNGAWSDGSKEWTPETMKELNHTFGDDGIFWISYKEFLKYYPYIDRIRLFGPEWTVTQQWASVQVPWTSDYLETKFVVSVSQKSPVVFVLSQPDDRYFQGLTGRYSYELHFRVYKEGKKTYLLRSMSGSGSGRSCTAELELEPGKYTVMVKVNATRYDRSATPEDIIKQFRENRREKLLAVGKSFDLTQSKGNLREAEKDCIVCEKKEAKKKAKAKLVAGRVQRKKERERERRRKARIEAEIERKKALKKQEQSKKEAEEPGEDGGEHNEDEAKPKQETEKADKPTDDEQKSSISSQPKKVTGAEKPAEKPEVVIAPSGPPANSAPSPAPKIVPESAPAAGSESKASSHPHHVGASPGQPFTPPVPTESAVNAAAKKDPEKIDSEKKEPEKKDSERKEENANAPLENKEMVSELREIANQLEAEEEEDRFGHANFGGDNLSDVSSVEDDDFDWDSDIDGSDDSESEEEDDESDDMYADDPWRAICVLGLRVFHADAGVQIDVVHKAS